MDLGNFSVSLNVKDLEASRAFYAKLGFEPVAGDASQNWLIMQNPGRTAIGLFQGMFEQNTLTFNPGWTSDMQALDTFSDVREIQRTLKAAGLELQLTADESTTGPGSLIVVDPDGNPILIDQHV
jgi:catechol 2,3-dioxygenase-like lactoylglutathione lyase family enzyme